MQRFIGSDPDQLMLMPHDLKDWLPEKHLSRFIVEIVDQLDFRSVYGQYKGVGSAAYDPKMLLSLLFYGYSTGVFSSRKLETMSYDSVAFRFICGNHHPDHDTISSFGKRFLPQIKDWFKQILFIGKELGFVKLGNIYIDGTKVQANASRHKAMSYEYMKKLEKQLEEEISNLLSLAHAQDEKEAEIELDVPAEIERREGRLQKIRAAKEVVEQRAKERYAKEKEAYDAKMKAREEKERKTGKKPGGRVPKAPSQAPEEKDQYNFTDPQSRIMKTSKGFDQCYNAQAAVTDEMVIVGAYSNAHANDKEEFIPAINAVAQGLSADIATAVADTGYFSEKNIVDCQQKDIVPIIAKSREKHNRFLDKALNEPEGQECSPDQNCTHTTLSKKECIDIYKKRKQTVEPVFGIIKEILGFRRFLLRGEVETDAEWSLVCTAYNLKRFFNMAMA
jgi:transposase